VEPVEATIDLVEATIDAVESLLEPLVGPGIFCILAA
jgi:hypothetical protein